MNGHLKSNKTYQIWMLWVKCLIFLLDLRDGSDGHGQQWGGPVKRS